MDKFSNVSFFHKTDDLNLNQFKHRVGDDIFFVIPLFSFVLKSKHIIAICLFKFRLQSKQILLLNIRFINLLSSVLYAVIHIGCNECSESESEENNNKFWQAH